MTTSPPTRKILTFLLSKDLLVVANKVGGIVKVLNIILSILFRSIPGQANKIFNRATFIFFYRLLIKQIIYLKGFGDVNVTIDKYSGGYIKPGMIVRIIG